jgi:hypothetical protein
VVHALAEKAKILEAMGRFEQASLIWEDVRRKHPDFAGQEVDPLADLLAADSAWRETADVEPPVTENGESSSVTPMSEIAAGPEEVPAGDATSFAGQAATGLPECVPVEPEGADSEQTTASDLAAAPHSKSSLAVKREPADSAAGDRRKTVPAALLTKREEWELVAGISEARLLRKWARRNEATSESPTPTDLRQKSGRLLEDVLLRVPNHPGACIEWAYLLIESGSLQDARSFIAEKMALMQSAIGLHQALARVNRELARQQGLQFDHEHYAMLIKPLLQLQQRNPAFEPLAYLGRGRICLAMHDGQPLRKAAARDFENLHQYVSEKPQRDGEFQVWWREQIQNLLFSNLDPKTPLTADNLETVERGLSESGQRIDVLEEDFTIRMSR